MRSLASVRALLAVCALTSPAAAGAGQGRENAWTISDPILLPGPQGSFDEVAVKDPSIVFFEGMWHVFYTARGRGEYTTGYVSARDLADLKSARRHELKMIRGKSRYGCAPQVLYYEPQRKWYLIFQTRDSNYQPVFSTTTTISDPQSWSKPAALLQKDNRAKWIDFWVICDRRQAYLFYTQEHRGVFVRTTSLTQFPGGWSEGREVFSGVHEAVHVYRVKGRDEYHMVYELSDDGERSFGLAAAESLEGPWKKATDRYATGDQLRRAGKGGAWAEMVSHGELIRTGYNQELEYEPGDSRWVIQAILRKESRGPYESLPWKLGIMTPVKPGPARSAPADAIEPHR